MPEVGCCRPLPLRPSRAEYNYGNKLGFSFPEGDICQNESFRQVDLQLTSEIGWSSEGTSLRRRRRKRERDKNSREKESKTQNVELN